MPTRLLLALLFALPLAGADLWHASVAAYGGAQVADITSSLGKLERNRLLRSSNGTFGAQGVVIKSGLAAGTITAQALVLRKWPKAKKAAAIINFATAAGVTLVAVKNIKTK